MRQLAGRPALLALVGDLEVAQLAWHPDRAICGQMTMAGCLGVAVLVVAALGVVTWIVRAAWLAVTATRAVAGLPRLTAPAALVAAAGRSGAGEVVCVADPGLPRSAPGCCDPGCL